MKVKNVLKWIGIGVGVLIGVIVAAGAFLYYQGGQTFHKAHSAPADGITIPTGADAAERGKRLATIHLCRDCHEEDLQGGMVLIDDPNIATFVSANLTSGKGGIGGKFSDQDWVNAIRYGVNRKGESLMIMPSELYHDLSDEDLGDLIAYLKALPPVDNVPAERRIGPLGRLIIATGQFTMAADLVEKRPPRPAPVAAGPTAEYGAYLGATICAHCHGDNMAGAMWPNGSPDAKLTPNLTPGGELLVWSQADFVKAMRTGEAPGGKNLDPERMPWKHLGQMSDDELAAVYAYLKSLPKTASPTPSK